MKTVWIVNVFNRVEKKHETLAMCEDCLVRMETEWGDRLYTVVEELKESIECENEFCEHQNY